MLILMLMVPLAAIGAALLTQGTSQILEQDSSRGRARALINAEVGIDHALAQLIANGNNHAPIVEYYPGQNTLRYQVELTDLGADGADNDGDLEVDEADEVGFVQLDSAGSVNVLGYEEDGTPVAEKTRHYVKRIRGIARTLDGLPSFPYAVYVGDPNAETEFNGNAFVITGYPHDANGDAEAGSVVPAIACTGDPQLIINQIAHQQEDNVLGSGGTPSVQNTAPVDLQTIIDDYKSMADIVLTNPEGTFHGSLGNPDTQDFKITHVVGNLDIAGNSKGAGLLLVEGNLEVTGDFEYVGIIIVTGQVIFRGGGSVKRLIGTMLIEGDLIDTTWEGDLEVSGTIDLIFSWSVQQDLANALSRYRLQSWQEL